MLQSSVDYSVFKCDFEIFGRLYIKIYIAFWWLYYIYNIAFDLRIFGDSRLYYIYNIAFERLYYIYNIDRPAIYRSKY